MSNSDIGNLPFSDTSDSDNSQENTTAQENPTTEENPIDDNLGPPFDFICRVPQAKILKFAIEDLCDPVHNNLGLGRIDVDGDGFNVTVEKRNSNVVGHLFLKPSEFGCTKPTEGMIVNLRQLYQKLITVFDDDHQLTIFQDDGINKLYVGTIGGDWPTLMIDVELVENDAEIPKFPELSSLPSARVLSNDLRSMLEHLLGGQAPYQVTVEMMENTTTLKVGDVENGWIRHYPMLVGVEPGERYRASFEWSRAEWLNRAMHIETSLAVCLTEPPTYIVWRFYLREGEYLEYVKEPIP